MSEATPSKTPTTANATKKGSKSRSTATKRPSAASRTKTSGTKAKTATADTKRTKTTAAASGEGQRATTRKTASQKAAGKAATKKTPKTAAKSAPKKTTKATASSKNVPAPAEKSAPADDAADGDDDRPKIAAAPMRPALRVAKRAEARRDKNQVFKVRTQIIYPAHGVGYITEIEKQSIADIDVELFVIEFEQEKMKLRVPVAKAANSGMRNLSIPEHIDDAMKLLEGKARVKRTMWSRRAQEYEAKINSGDLISVAEVVRDLYRADDQPEQSYSERQLFEQARERFAREVAAVRKKSMEKAIDEIHQHLARKVDEKADEKAEG